MRKLLTEAEMIEILKSKKINEQTPLHKRQIMEFAFGYEFMKSDDKGSKQTYAE